jgi:hypothetical protein
MEVAFDGVRTLPYSDIQVSRARPKTMRTPVGTESRIASQETAKFIRRRIFFFLHLVMFLKTEKIQINPISITDGVQDPAGLSGKDVGEQHADPL